MVYTYISLIGFSDLRIAFRDPRGRLPDGAPPNSNTVTKKRNNIIIKCMRATKNLFVAVETSTKGPNVGIYVELGAKFWISSPLPFANGKNHVLPRKSKYRHHQ